MSGGAATLAQRLAAFAAGLTDTSIPPVVVADVKLRALDVIGIALASSRSEVAPSLSGMVDAWGTGGECTVIGNARSAGPAAAALVNGALAHALDFDDTHAGSITHASAVVLPAALAVGEARRLDGRTVIRAAVAGYETIARLGMAAPGAFHARGWHATAACGTLAAAVAAGVASGLDAAGITTALGIAGSFASGLLEFLEDGSWVKRVHPGWAAHGGVVAAALAAGGFTGPATVLEGRFGFYRTFLDLAPDPAPFETLGVEWETLRVGYKPYPCCHYLHAFIDCALAIRADAAFGLDDIDVVECVVPPGQVPVVCEPRESKVRPRTAYDAQFSLPFSVAAALVHGAVGVDTYEAARLGDPTILRLAARVDHVLERESRFPAVFPGRVRVRLANGLVLEAAEPDARGGPNRPLPEQAIVEKFRANAGRALGRQDVERLESALSRLEDVRDVRDALSPCRAAEGVK